MYYFLCRPNYAYPYTTNLTYNDTMVLITKNYFSHQTSELGTSYCKCQADLIAVLVFAFHMCNFVLQQQK